MPRFVFVFPWILACLAPTAPGAEESQSGEPITVVVARDAGIATDGPRDLTLTSLGAAVVAGHPNTVPGLVMGLGGSIFRRISSPHGDMLGDDEHERLFMGLIPASEGDEPGPALRTLELRRGP